MSTPIFINAFVLSVALVACYFDIKARIIPNWLTYPCLLIAISVSVTGLSIGFLSMASGFAMGFLPAFALFSIGVLGGGDVKLLGALGAMFGFPQVVDFLFWSAAFGAILGVFAATQQSRGSELFNGVKDLLISTYYGVSSHKLPLKDLTIPFALPILMSVVMVIWFPHWSVLTL